MNVAFPQQPDWAWLKRTFTKGVLLRVDHPLDQVLIDAPRGRMAYLATPYSREVVDADLRFDFCLAASVELRAARWARLLALRGITAVSPITQASMICAADFDREIDPLDAVFWGRWCQPMLEASGSVIVPAIAGWDRSAGIWHEVCWALRHNVPVFLVKAGAEFEGAL